jgi:UDP-2,4-diacetamido-2,4,6-trideoxy-beta-L-altropyranose hydrolase
MTKTRVVFRADGNSEVGLGHVVRSLALAEMLQEEFECVFAIQEPSEALGLQIEAVCSGVYRLPLYTEKSEALIGELDPYLTGREIVVLDGYKFDTLYQQHIKEKGCVVVCIDDIHAYHFVANVVINHAGSVSREDYSVALGTQCYFGPQYALLRPNFLKVGKQKQSSVSLNRVFINMGGADPNNDLCSVLAKVSSTAFFQEVHVVTGSAYRFEKELQRFIEQDRRITHYKNLSAHQMANLMAKCGVGICPPSSVAYEYASVGGLLFLKQIAENQQDVKTYFLREQLALDFECDFPKVLSSDLGEEQNIIISNQRCLLDCKSDERLLAVFRRVKQLLTLTLRRAHEEDLMLCYQWANDTEVRAQSFNPEPITLQQHCSWFEKKIADSQTRYYIVEIEGIPVGQIRFEGGEAEQVISYLISPEMRGQGLGSVVLLKGVGQLLSENSNVKKISGYVKESNLASCRAFERAGFIQAPQSQYPYSLKYEILPSSSKANTIKI